jgi:DUF1680 family protein
MTRFGTTIGHLANLRQCTLVRISINGTKHDSASPASSCLTLDRTWYIGDKIEIAMSMSLYLAPTPDDATVLAPRYGPVILAARLGAKDLTGTDIYGPPGPSHKKSIPVPPIVNSTNTDQVEPIKGEKLAFLTVGQSANFDLVPFYQLFDERYTVYWKEDAKTA